MQSKIYRANTMSQAVAGLREDLGSDAVILETRTVRRTGFWGMLGATIVEVHAARAAEVRDARRRSAASTDAVADDVSDPVEVTVREPMPGEAIEILAPEPRSEVMPPLPPEGRPIGRPRVEWQEPCSSGLNQKSPPEPKPVAAEVDLVRSGSVNCVILSGRCFVIRR